jgi:hypothetical protein
MLRDFISSFTDELAKPSRFSVKINIPLQLNGIIDTKTLSLRCENASLPGRTISTSDLRIYGPTEKFPYQTAYSDISLTFIVSGSMIEKTLFDRWLEYINPSTSWNFEYKKNYVSEIIVTQYDQAQNEMQNVKLIDAFPVGVNQLDLDWSNDSSYHKLTVTFAYTYWEVLSTAQPSQAVSASKNSPFNLAAALQIGALAANVGKSLTSGNPYAILGAAGAAASIIPSIGGTKTLSSVINTQGRGTVDTRMDQNASKVNSNKNTIPGLSSTTNRFNL